MTNPIDKTVTMGMERKCTRCTAGCFCCKSLKAFYIRQAVPSLESQAAEVPGDLLEWHFIYFFLPLFLLLVRAAQYCQMTTWAEWQGIPILSNLPTSLLLLLFLCSCCFLTGVSSTLFLHRAAFLCEVASLSHYSRVLCCAGYKRARFTSTLCLTCLRGRSKCEGFV